MGRPSSQQGDWLDEKEHRLTAALTAPKRGTWSLEALEVQLPAQFHSQVNVRIEN